MSRLLERSTALAALQSSWVAAARGSGSVVLVTGEAGSGKSALVAEFVRSLDTAAVLMGACDNLSTDRPHGPLRDAVAGSDGPLAVALESGANILDATLAHLRTEPTVLVIEDLQWADRGTLDVLAFLAKRIGNTAALVVATARDGDPGLPGRRIPLQPLSVDAVACLVGTLDAADLHARTGGNPFFVTEMITADSDLPDSVVDAVATRIRELDPQVRAVVERLAVIEGTVEYELAEALLGPAFEHVVVAERARFVESGAAGIRFCHDIVRRAIEANLSALQRRTLRLAAVAAERGIGAHRDVQADGMPRHRVPGAADRYERAVELAESGTVPGLRQALSIFDGLNALPAAALVRARLKRLGVDGVPRGPQSYTRAHPAGLTARQSDVLALLAEGLTNAEIAERLCLSVRTVDHHVAAILGKLGVASRRDARVLARDTHTVRGRQLCAVR